MVHRTDMGNVTPDLEYLSSKSVKAELDEFFLENYPFPKRPKLDQCGCSPTTSAFHDISSTYDPLEEPSPLGLKLKKSPSLLDLIQMRLSQPRSASLSKTLPKKEKDQKGTVSVDKLKASNFPATLLRIGTWEYKSRYEGDLVAKCYFAKHKLVWEVLDGGLKNKLEIQWSDIMAIKGNYPDDTPGTLDVVLARQPLFFREINPQPRKHTLWQATSDFTGGQATINRRHFVECSPGLLGKHFEKLLQCDPRLNFLSTQPELMLDNPHFEVPVAVLMNPNDSEASFGLKIEDGSTSLPLQNVAPATGACLSPSKIEVHPVDISHGNPPCGPVTGDADSRIKETEGQRLLSQIRFHGLQKSMSVGDFVNHIGQCISEQMVTSNPSEDIQKNSILEEITQYLLNDPQIVPDSDEKSVMSKVNSLCCLLQRDPSVQNFQVKSLDGTYDALIRRDGTADECKAVDKLIVLEGETSADNGCKQTPGIPRVDSVGDLLLNLPRIASLPRLLFNISEDFGNQDR